MHVLKEKRQKLDEKSIKCILVGYFEASKVYRCYDPLSGKVHISRDVLFEEGGLTNQENGVEDTTPEFQVNEDYEPPHNTTPPCPQPLSPSLLATSSA